MGYSLASVPWLLSQPHYRAGTFQEDMRTNLRNVVLPTGLYGIPLSICVLNKMTVVLTGLLLIPFSAFVGSLWRKWKGLEDSASECFRRTLLEPTDWFQLWRLNCRLASMVALATKSKDFDMEDKWLFIKTCMEKYPSDSSDGHAEDIDRERCAGGGGYGNPCPEKRAAWRPV